MDPQQYCPRCATSSTGPVCPVCGAATISADQPRPRARNSVAANFLVGAGTIYLGVLFLAVFVGYGIIHSLKTSKATKRSQQIPPRPPITRDSMRHHGPVAQLNSLKGTGCIYLVQMGTHTAPYSLDDFAQWLRSKYALDVRVLAPSGPDAGAFDASRRQYVAELLYAGMKREHPDLAADSNAYLIGFTDASMYSVFYRWSSTFSQRDHQRAAVISANGMEDSLFERRGTDAATANQHFEARMRRVLLKDVAVLYWHLPLNNDPSSVLHETLDPDVPTEDIYESDLAPERSETGQDVGPPCIYFLYSPKDGVRPLPGPVVHTCEVMEPLANESDELFSVNLSIGLFTDQHTDVYVPDSIPIQFERATRDGWKGPAAFGMSGTHNYDDFLGSADNIKISVYHDDGSTDDLIRVPQWLPFPEFVKYVDTTYSGKYFDMRWHQFPFEHYDLKRYDGFVQTYLPCDSPTLHCYLTGEHNAQGEELKFDRGDKRRLFQLTSPNRSWVRLNYDSENRVSRLDDSRGRSVRYTYDERGRLAEVTYPSGQVFHYRYDDTQHVLSVAVSTHADAPPAILVSNEYSDGFLTRQTLPDGGVYTYSYTPADKYPFNRISVGTPDRRTLNIEPAEDGWTVREQIRDPYSPARQTGSDGGHIANR